MSSIDHEAERQHEAVEALNNVKSPPIWTIGGPMTAVADAPASAAVSEIETAEGAESSTAAVQQEPRRPSNDSDISMLMLSPRPAHHTPAAISLTRPTRQYRQTSPPSEDVMVLSGTSQNEPCGLNMPYGLRPTEHDTHHAPHPLDGPRHTSRCGIAENDQFALLCSKYGQWLIDSTPDPHTTIKIGHGSGLAFRYFQADFLDFPGVKAIKIVVPVCAAQLRSLDWDVVRAVALHLRQYVGKRAVSISNRDEAVQQAEDFSLRLVEFELEGRSWERKRAAEIPSDSDASDAVSGPPLYNGPDHPLRYENRSFLSVTALAPMMATPPEHTGRPEFNTRRCTRRRVTEGEFHMPFYSVESDEHNESTPHQSYPGIDSYPPGADTHAVYDSDGTCVGQYTVYEQNADSSRSSRVRPRFEDLADETLGVNYACTGQDGWY